MSSSQPFNVRVSANQLGTVATNMYSVLQTWEWKTKLPGWATELELDFTPVKFIEPWALTLFAAYARWMSFANCTDSTKEAIATVAAYSAKYYQINF